MSRFARYALLAAGLLGFTQAQAQDDELLRVEEAFALTSQVVGRDAIKLEWKIADGYYLYRTRMSTRSSQADLNLAPLELPPGEPKNDEFLGQVEVYHGKVTATQALKPGPDLTTAEFAVTIQGCHEREPKICYPPYTAKLSLPLPPPEPGAAAAEPAGAGLLRGPAAATPPGALSSALNQLGKPAADAPMDTGTAVPGEEKLPLPPEQAFVFETIATGPTELLARWTMPKGYYLYRDKTRLSVPADSGVRLGTPRWPVGTPHKDEHYGDVTVYFDQVELPIDLGRDDGKPAKLKLQAEFQGCENDGVCYPIMTRTVEVELPQASAAQLDMARAKLATSAAPAAAASGNAEDQSEEQRLAAQLSSDRLLALISFFGFGLLLAFTPCVFPMLPILSGIIAGAGENVSTRRAFVLSTVYVLASTLVFTIAGVAAGLVGANLQALFQQPWILTSFAILFVLLSLSMFGFYELQLPSSLQSRIASVSNRQQGGSLTGVAVMGVLSALIVGPCVAPPLAAAVLYISQTRDPVFGGLALFTLSLGMGAPLVVAGTAAGKWLPRAGAWMDSVKAVFGVSFLALAIYMVSRFLDAGWIMLMIGVLAVACGVYLGALERLPEEASGWRRLWKSLGVVLLIAGAAQLVGAFAGSADPLQPLRGLGGGGGSAAAPQHLPFRTIKTIADVEAQLKQGKPVMLDFYADWCVSCKEMEKFTFTKSDVHAALQPYTLLKADVTANDAEDQALLKHFGLVGPPVTIFFGADGKERRAQRLTGFESAEKFVARVAKAAGR
ncbi:protein-disulfide reductase DsbD [Tahibacter harae]|uniref:Thiol:disulfide interchange protein DsbD n=1 Tax=Tahibacter harae TaxID=2963937 RepID=A0ABT1QPK9_9GAMM|nr:protein-disulfide reductase DsbD [Tahibacter harae]MCQ4164224.1 protein-disulfide reductase DsbD [Tahibacter harae]